MEATHVHKLSGCNLTIHKNHGEVITCNLVDEPKVFNSMGELKYQRCVCLVENVIKKPN